LNFFPTAAAFLEFALCAFIWISLSEWNFAAAATKQTDETEREMN